jgi:dephospho-CoA kinase
VEQRLKEQDYSDEIKGFADFVIENNSTLEALRTKSEVIVSIIQAMAIGELPDDPLRSIEPEEE